MNQPKVCLWGLANTVERSDLNRTLMPEPTKTHQCIQHGDFVDMVEDAANDAGFVFGEMHHALWRDGDARYFGLTELKHSNENAEFALMLGIRNSYDKSISAQLLLGARVYICANMSYSASNVVGRKHTTHIMRDLNGLVVEQIQKTEAFAKIQEERFDAYREHKITDTRADRLMINMLRTDAIQSTKFRAMVQEWYEPRYDHGPKRAWRLFNACTEALKGTPAHDMPRRTMGLQSILDAEVQFDKVA